MFGLGAARKKKAASTSTVFTAIPLAGCRSFTFASLAEYEEKFAKISKRCEELEIDLHEEGFPGAAELWKAFTRRFSMAQLADWYDRVEPLRPEEKAALFHALEYKGIDDLDEALRWVDDEGRPFEGDTKAFAQDFADDQGSDFFTGKDAYFDFESFGQDLKFDLDADNEDDSRQLDMSDKDLGEEYVDSMGGVQALGKETVERYFDWDYFARDLDIGGDTVEYEFAGQTWTIWAN